MKIASNTVEVTSNIVFDETFKVGIADDDEAVKMVIERLISAYDNPYRAALREYTSNAYDEHVQAGVSRPIEVSLPDEMSPVLKVQDFGRGLTRDELKGFGTIGKSTKRDSNKTTGGFGMGSKCALAAAPQFTVVSVKNGRRNTVIVARDENNVPHMNFLAETETEDESGTTVIIPISDREKFGSLKNFWIGWPDGSILIDDEAPKGTVYDDTVYRETIPNTAYRSLSWESSGRDVIRFLINQVYYEVDYRKIDLEYNQWNILKFYILRIENGSVDIAPSRETLQFNARTKAAIAQVTGAVLTQARVDHAAAVEAAPDLKTALALRDRMFRDGYPVNDLRWNGQPFLLPGKVYKGNQLPDASGTWAVPQKSYNSKSGWIVDKTYGQISAKDIWRNTEHRKFVIIHSADPATTYSTGRRSYNSRMAHREAFGVGDYLSTIDHAKDHGWDWFITSEPLGKINKLYRDLADMILPAEQFNSTIKKVRADRAREARLAAADKVKDTRLKVLTESRGGVPYIYEMTAEQVRDKYDAVIFLRNQCGGITETFRNVMTTKTNYTRRESETAQRIARNSNAAMILIGKNDDVKPYLPLLPKVLTFEQAVVQQVLATYKKTTKYERMALRDRASLSVSAVAQIADDWMTKIKRRETREWAKAVKEYQDPGATLRDSYSWLAYYVPELKKALEGPSTAKKAELPESPLVRYPLLSYVNYGANSRDIVTYINTMDAATKG